MSFFSNIDQNSFKNISLYLIKFVATVYLISILPTVKYAKIARKNQENWQQYQSELQEIWNDYNSQRSQNLKFVGKTKILNYEENFDSSLEYITKWRFVARSFHDK